mgnify:CR=1 FL=1
MSLLSDHLVETFLEQSSQGVVVLLPGGFKPPHAGQLDLVTRYTTRKDVSEVRILIGPKTRDQISRSQSMAVWRILVGNNPKVHLQAVTQDNPLLAAYQFIETAEPGTYALAASNKGDDYTRVQNFVQQHQPGAKYARQAIKVVELSVDVNPLVYKGRQDDKDGQPISGSTLRDDAKQHNLSNFKTNYPGIGDTQIKQIYKILNPNAPLNEANVIKSNILRDNRELLTCGGAAGHLAHPYEDVNLTFLDIENMIEAALSGKVELAQEKLDGQNLMVSYRGGQVVAARNKGQLKNFGENALSAKQVRDMFNGRGAIQTAFTEAMNDLEAAIGKLTTMQKSKFFENGKRFLNLELLYPATTNVISYGATQLRLHSIKTYDKQGNVIDEDTSAAAQLDEALQQVQADNQKTYQIRVTNPLTINKSSDYEKQKKELVDQLTQVRSKFSLSERDKVSKYYVQWWGKLIDDYSKQLNYQPKPVIRKALILRWGFGNKSYNLSQIKKAIFNDQFRSWVDNFDKHQVQLSQKQATQPIENLFLKLGVYTLRNAENLVALNPNQSVSEIKNQLRATINQIKSLANSPDQTSTSALQFLKYELARLRDIGGFKAIVPSEGLVFKYNGKLFKLTGAFAPINKILGYLKFG